MKNNLLLITLFTLISTGGGAQNTFPSNENVTLDRKSIDLKIFPSTTSGGWARGLNYRSYDNLNLLSGFGAAGSGSSMARMYMAHGSSPWSSSLGLYILPDGNVGVGTINPASKLHIVSGTSGGESKIHFQNGTTAPNGSITLSLNPNNTLSRGAEIQALAENPNQTALIFKTNFSGQQPVERLRIDTKGNVGIGTTNPEGNLQVGESTGNGMIFLGGGKGYSGIGSTRSDGGLVLGYNIYSRYDDSSDNFKARIAKTTSSTQGYSGIKISQQGVIDFFGYRGKAIADEIANTDESIKMKIDKYGNIGIGTVNPTAKLHIDNGNNSYGAILANASESAFSLYTKTLTIAPVNTESFRLGLKYNDNENNGFISFYRGGSVSGGFLGFSTNGQERMSINKDGNVGIGTTDTKGYELGVNGKIITEEVKVELYANWSDFVFDSSYNLPTLTEVENHIIEKGHLKDIPSAKEVAENGFYLAEMNAKLLQKIEELTLYTIQQEKELKSQKEALANQNKKIESLLLKNDKLKTIEEQLKSIENRLNTK